MARVRRERRQLVGRLVVGCTLVAACAGTGPKARVSQWDGAPREPRPPGTPIEVLERSEIARPFTRVALVQISTQRLHSDDAEAKVLEIFVRKARELGGDALMNFGRTAAGGQQSPVPYSRGPSMLQDTWSAVVIVWIEAEQEAAEPQPGS